jgi:DNA-binding transcriptional MerR regulator
MTLVTTKTAAAILGLTPDAVRWHERKGNLLAIKVDRGQGVFMRLFLEEDVEQFLRKREARKVMRSHDA